jgi:hypothetical protein
LRADIGILGHAEMPNASAIEAASHFSIRALKSEAKGLDASAPDFCDTKMIR